MNRMILQTVVCIALVATMPSCSRPPQAQESLGKGELIQRKPEPQAVFNALGLRTWQIELSVPDRKPYDLAIYSRIGHNQAHLIGGNAKFNFSPDAPHIKKIVVTVAIQTVQIQSSKNDSRQERFIVGISEDADGTGGVSWTDEIESPFSAYPGFAYAGPDLRMDEQGRVLLAYSEGDRSFAPGRPIDDYLAVIYLQFAPASK